MSANALRRLRRENGYTQRQLAQELMLSESAVKEYEQGRRKMSKETLSRLEQLIDAPAACLLNQPEEEEKMEEIISEIKIRLMQRGIYEKRPAGQKSARR